MEESIVTLVMLEFGTITLKIMGNNKIWLKQIYGEGMEVSGFEIEKLLQDYYKGNF